jgi:hypothetical protein
MLDLTPPTLGRGFVPIVELGRLTAGVDTVRGVDVPDVGLLASCFVGDLVGDRDCVMVDARGCDMLDGRAIRGAGLGEAVFMLILFEAPKSVTLPVLRAAAAPAAPGPMLLVLLPATDVLAVLLTILLGLDVFFTVGAGFAAGLGAAATSVTAVGRTNMPFPGAQSKYRSPWTAPSFLPSPSISSTPTHSPVAKLVVPAKRTMPLDS